MLTVVFKLWLVGAQSILAIAPSPHDDGHFVHQARAILGGWWLGPFDVMTLSKGPGYPIWLAATSLAGIPLLLAQALLYGLACGIMVIALRPVLRGTWARLGIFAALLFNPASWANAPATRVIRDGFYSSLTLLLLAGTIGLALRLGETWGKSRPWAALAGFTGGAFVLTREEGIWLVPSLALLLGIGVARGWGGDRRAMARSALVGLGMTLLPVGAVATMNWREYGVFTVGELRSSEFKDAYGALTRVIGGEPRRYVPVSREARRQIEQVSPAYAEISSKLERVSPNWIAYGCGAVGVCDDFAAGWFIWAFRDAVAAAGKYRNDGRGPTEYYRRLAREIDDACDSGRLKCLPPRSTLSGPWEASYFSPVWTSLTRSVRFLVTMEQVTPLPGRSRGPEELLLGFEALTHEQIPRGDPVTVGGVTGFRFAVLGSLTRAYGLVLPALVPLALLLVAWRIVRGRRDDGSRVIPSISLALFGAVAARLVLLSVIDATAFPAINVLYCAPAYGLLIAGVSLTLVSEAQALRWTHPA
jgi:hypothetical protein